MPVLFSCDCLEWWYFWDLDAGTIEDARNEALALLDDDEKAPYWDDWGDMLVHARECCLKCHRVAAVLAESRWVTEDKIDYTDFHDVLPEYTLPAAVSDAV